ncbi:MAG: DegV family EDD domain-containing protein [Spirochaetaceae bacterium]|nr:DegV family EDD domain-containing protein [Spirochaetaceae bacterium]
MNELNGRHLYGAFRSGARKVRASQDELNRINVFPVPDGDTGTNMAVTITRAVEGALVSDSASDTLVSMADAALAGARGNSGVIFAQFVAGFSDSIHGAPSVNRERFVRAMEQAYESAYRAITEPREGTILSVIRDWAAALRREHQRAESFRELFRAAAPALRESLAATTGQLEELAAAGVVDAGASGFVAFIDGAHEYLEAGAPVDEAGVPVEGAAGAQYSDAGHAGHAGHDGQAGSESASGDFRYRYCSEFLLAAPAGERLDLEALRGLLKPLGDSLIVAGGVLKARVHVHTDDPARAMEELCRKAWVIEQKVDDMRLQFADLHDRRARVALVTDSACDLPAELLEEHRVHVAPLYLRFGEREYLDRITLDPDRFYDLADAAPVFPTSSQPAAAVLERLYRRLLGSYDEVVAIHLSAKLSGTLEASRRAALAVDPSRVRVLDSRHLSGSLGLVVLRAAEYLESGGDAAGLEAELPAWSRKALNLVGVRTLRYMVRGGRVSPLGGALAKILNLKPIVSVDEEGASKLYGASFSRRANLSRIVAMVKDRHAVAPLRAYAVVHAHAGAEAEALARRLEAVLGFPPLHVSEISVVVGMNAGRGALSVVAMSE